MDHRPQDPGHSIAPAGAAAEPSRFARFCRWLERATRPANPGRRDRVDAEGALVNDPNAGIAVAEARWPRIRLDEAGGGGPGRVVVTRERLRVYSWTDHLVFDVAIADLASGKLAISWPGPRTFRLRIPRDAAVGGGYAGRDCRFTIESDAAEVLRRLIVGSPDQASSAPGSIRT